VTAADREGHHARLRARYDEAGISSLADYEIVELLLAYVTPRRDTKSLAKELLRKFKSLGGLLNADTHALVSVKGIGERSAQLFRLVRDASAYCLQEKFERRPLRHRSDVEEYLRFNFGSRGDEYVAAVYLDNGNNVLSTEIVCEGTVNQCAVYPRTIVEKAVRCKAASVILAHNHPGGATGPSEADWAITLRLFEICRLLEIQLLDHVIVTRDAAVSLRDLPRWPDRRGSMP
jgi:DNA repair protein RadC